MKDCYVYPAILSFDDDGITVEFPDLPGCVTCGDTEEDAISMAREALQLHLYGMEEDGDEIPKPSRITELTLEKNQIPVLIEAWMPAFRDKMAHKSVTATVTLPRWLKIMSDRAGLSYSYELQAALKRRLGIKEPPYVSGK
ncbi:MAG: type II toxin-antitoxin system HicB family antitoxin [Desulfurispora sp.]|uniref:type II toxin-antitoxin system HicB family antitoxin n=1 Tax=Desulfurispora sp. TaxID=3014275 RepID=UPI00404B16B0